MPLIKLDPKVRSLIYFLAALVGPILVATGKATETQWAEIVGYFTTLTGAAVAVDNRPTEAGLDAIYEQVIAENVDKISNQAIADFISNEVSWSNNPESAVPQVETPEGVTPYEGD